MSLSIVTFAQLGKQFNLKTPDILPVISEFQERGELQQVIAFAVRGTPLSYAIGTFPRPLSALLRICRMSRENVERVFDYIAALFLKKNDIVIIHPMQFPRSISAAKSKGSLTVGIAVEAHPLYNRQLYKEECIRLGITPEYRHPWTQRMADTMAMCDYIIAPSEFVKETFVDQGYSVERIIVAGFDIDVSRFASISNQQTQKFTVLYVADTQPLKGLHYLIEAWNKLSLQNAELIILGSFISLPSSLAEQYYSSIHANLTIRHIEHVFDPETYFAQASLYVCPSLTEGYGRTIVEAMASGLPVITTEHARAIVEDGVTGFVVPIRDVQALQEKIQLVYNDEIMRQRIGLAARNAVKNKKSFGKSVYEIYTTLMNKRTFV